MTIYSVQTNRSIYDSVISFLGLKSRPGLQPVTKDYINNLISYRAYDFSITQSGTAAPVVTRLAAGAAECTHACSSASPCACDCPSSCLNETSTSATAFMTFTRTAAGKYRLTVTLPAEYVAIQPRAVTNVGLFFAPFTSKDYRVSVTKISATVYDVWTYNDGVGAYADDLFSNTIVAARVYF